MAEVKVDISEYDMLRDGKNKAEQEVKELKETIKGLKDKSRVVLTTKTVIKDINSRNLAKRIVTNLNSFEELKKSDDIYIFNPYQHYSTEDFVNKIIYEYINDYRVYRESYSQGRTIQESSQYIGFNDIELKVRSHFEDSCKEELKKKYEEVDKLKEEYQDKLDTVDEVNAKKWELKKKVKDSHIKQLNDEISALKSTIKELTKSKEERIAEAEVQLKEAQKVINSFKEKKGFWSKLFKRNVKK